MAPEKNRRYGELASKRDRGPLTAAEKAEMTALVRESEELMLENARALLRHRDPLAYAAIVAEEHQADAGRARVGQRGRQPDSASAELR
jgi:hypothetical protein